LTAAAAAAMLLAATAHYVYGVERERGCQLSRAIRMVVDVSDMMN